MIVTIVESQHARSVEGQPVKLSTVVGRYGRAKHRADAVAAAGLQPSIAFSASQTTLWEWLGVACVESEGRLSLRHVHCIFRYY